MACTTTCSGGNTTRSAKRIWSRRGSRCCVSRTAHCWNCRSMWWTSFDLRCLNHHPVSGLLVQVGTRPRPPHFTEGSRSRSRKKLQCDGDLMSQTASVSSALLSPSPDISYGVKTGDFQAAGAADESSHAGSGRYLKKSAPLRPSFRDIFGRRLAGEEVSRGFPGKRHRSEDGSGRFSAVVRGPFSSAVVRLEGWQRWRRMYRHKDIRQPVRSRCCGP